MYLTNLIHIFLLVLKNRIKNLLILLILKTLNILLLFSIVFLVVKL
nr:MAG TPA: hypothetical protein [Caudoviricetes sp.]